MKKNKSILKNFIYNILLTLLNLLFPIITFPYISRVLGAEGVGKVTFVTSIVNYFLIFATLGIPNYGVREIAKNSNDKKEVSKIFSEILVINIISSLASCILYFLMILSLGFFKQERILYVVVGLSLVLNVFSIDWMYRGLENYKYITRRSIIFKMLSIVLLFVLVRAKQDYVKYAIISVIALSGANIVNVLTSRKYIDFSFKNLNLTRHLKSIFILLSTEVAINIYVNLDSTMVGIISGNKHLGYYTAAIKINKIIATMVTSLGIVLMPRLSYYIKQGMKEEFEKLITKSVQYILFIGLPAVVGLFILSPQIVRLFSGNEFTPAILAMRITTPIVLFLGISNLTGIQLLIPLGKEKKLFYAVIIAAIVNFTLNLILIPMFQQNGAAISTTIVEIVVALIQLYFVREYMRGKIINKYNLRYIIGCALMGASVYLIQLLHFGDLTTLFISVLIGAAIYLVYNIIIRENILIEILHRFKINI